jgi:hypothetical protein
MTEFKVDQKRDNGIIQSCRGFKMTRLTEKPAREREKTMRKEIR